LFAHDNGKNAHQAQADDTWSADDEIKFNEINKERKTFGAERTDTWYSPIEDASIRCNRPSLLHLRQKISKMLIHEITARSIARGSARMQREGKRIMIARSLNVSPKTSLRGFED
jgi:hypothetical protein